MVLMSAVVGCGSVMADDDTLAVQKPADSGAVVSIKEFNFKTHASDFTVLFTDENARYIIYGMADPKTMGTKKPLMVLTAYRVADMKKLFSMEVPMLQGQDFKLVDSEQGMLLVEIVNNLQIAVYRVESGEKLWEKSFSAFGNMRGIVGISNGVAMLRMAPGFGSLYFTGFSLTTGEKVWNEKLDASFGLSYNKPLGGDNDYIVTDALYRVNIKTGEHHKIGGTATAASFKASEFRKLLKDLDDDAASELICLHSLGIRKKMADLLTIKFCIPESRESKPCVVGLSSGILSDNGRNYFADRNSLICFDDNMMEIWRTELTKKGTRSDLYLKDGVIYMINHAVGTFSRVNAALQFESAYVAAFDAKDGHLLYLKDVDESNFHVDDIVVVGDKIHMLSNKAEAVFDMKTKEMSVKQTKMKYVHYHHSDDMYVRNLDDSFSAMCNSADMVVALGQDGNWYNIVDPANPQKVAHFSDVCIKCMSSNGMDFIGSKSKSGVGLDLWIVNDGKSSVYQKGLFNIEEFDSGVLLQFLDGSIKILSM